MTEYFQITIVPKPNSHCNIGYLERLNVENVSLEDAIKRAEIYIAEKSETQMDVWYKMAEIVKIEKIRPTGEFI
ncbi:MAG: hypothetical protein WAV09_01420 [Minisyncoccia bacterium]